MDTTDPLPFHESVETVLAHVIQSFMTTMKQHGLSTQQIHTLMYIYHAGECQVSDVAILSDASNAAASQLVERLVQQGLVDRREDPGNRRNKLVSLSGLGKELIHASVISNPFLAEIMTALAPDQRQVVHNAFTILAQMVRQMQGTQEKATLMPQFHAGTDKFQKSSGEFQ